MAVDYTNFIGPLKPTGPAPTGPTQEQDPNQDLYNQLLGMSSQRILTDTLSGLQDERQMTSQTYSQMYQDLLRSQRMQRGLSDTRGFSGGMAEQFGEKLGAAQIAAMGQVGMGREAAMRDISARERMAPYEAMTQAVGFQQTAQALDPRRQQLEVYAAAGDTQNWANLANEIYGTTLQYDPETGGFMQGGTGGGGGGGEPVEEPVIKPPIVDLSSPTLLPKDKTKAIKTTLQESFGDELNGVEIDRFIRYFGEKSDYTEEANLISKYNSRQLPFEEWQEIDRNIFQRPGNEAEFLKGSGGFPATMEGEERLYFTDPNSEFLLYLVDRYPERFGQDLTRRKTGPSGNFIQMTPQEAVEIYQQFLRNR